MSADADVNVVRAAWSAFSRGDLADMLRLLDSDVEVVPFGAAMEGKTYRGHKGVREWREREIVPNWELFEVHPDEFRRVGEKLLVLGRWRARGRTSGVELDRPAAWIVQVRQGRIASWVTYTDRGEALRSLGVDGMPGTGTRSSPKFGPSKFRPAACCLRTAGSRPRTARTPSRR